MSDVNNPLLYAERSRKDALKQTQSQVPLAGEPTAWRGERSSASEGRHRLLLRAIATERACVLHLDTVVDEWRMGLQVACSMRDAAVQRLTGLIEIAETRGARQSEGACDADHRSQT
jgi:hypothetical protein